MHQKAANALPVAIYVIALFVTPLGRAAASESQAIQTAEQPVSSGNSSVPQAHLKSAEGDVSLEEIVVTAQKRAQSILDVPVSITAFSGKMLDDYNITSFTDYATKVPNLSFSYGGSSQGTAGLGFSTSRGTAIRGITGPNATGFYIDDTPIMDSMDPRIVDVERIEVLKGPQGTLYGSGSLGGNVTIVTRKPSVTEDDFRYKLLSGYTDHGDFDYGADASANFVVVPETAAVRVVVYESHESPFLTRTYPAPLDPAELVSVPAGEEDAVGASVSLLVKPASGLDVTLRLLYQHQYYEGWPAAFAPLPAFRVVSYTLSRSANVQEVSSDRWSLPSLSINYQGTGWSLTSSTSYFERDTYDLEDGTSGTDYFLSQNYAYTPPSNVPIPWPGDSETTQVVNETRLSVDEIHHVRGILGVFFQNNDSTARELPAYLPGLAATGLWPNNLLYEDNAVALTHDSAVFGELYIRPIDPLTVTLGARDYSITVKGATSASGLVNGGSNAQPLTPTKSSGISPKLGLDYHLSPDEMVYVSASKGFRPGGVNNPLPPPCGPELATLGLTLTSALNFKPDSVWNYEVGTKASFLDQRMSLTAAAFQIDWTQVQQSIYLPICGYSLQGNSGAARNRGTEIEIDGRPAEPLTIRTSLGYQDAVITEAGNGSPQAVGSPVFNIPHLTGSAGAIYEWPLAAQVGTLVLSADYSHIGDSLSGNNTPAMPRFRPSYSVTNARVGLRRNGWDLTFFANNVFNKMANLGDLTTLSYEARIVNSEGINVPDPRVVTLRPLQVGLQFEKRL
jgi:iron complex outermembrane recepter protein